jgi:hypothetical protein
MLQALIVYISILLGKILNKIAKEEIAQYKEYLTTTNVILIILTALSFVYFQFTTRLIMAMVIGFLVFKPIKTLYPLLGLSTFTSFFTSTPILPLSLTTILTLFHSSLTKYQLKDLFLSLLYFSIPFLLFLIETLINQNTDRLIGLTIGGLLSQIRARGSAW